ncbi:MAG: hypothetical protein JKY37_13080 [Nannocystaceae bacterium]|nr:hypothetical protein [Nannocystaceae bacterium]
MLIRAIVFPLVAAASVAATSACGTNIATPAPTTTPSHDSNVATEAPAAAGEATALQPGVAAAAQHATDVSKIKIRLDASGKIVKQSVYHGDESKIAAPVLALAAEKFPGSKPRRYETEWYADLGEVHEVEVETADGKTCEVAAKPDGTELYVECHEPHDSLSATVKTLISESYPDGKILEVESKTRPNVNEITIEIESGGVEYYVIVSPDGSNARTMRRIPAIVEVPVVD